MAVTGTAGVPDHVPGNPTTVSAAAAASGGIGPGNFIESDIDRELYAFKSDDTPLMQLMLRAKTIKVDSPVVEHYMIDEPISSFATAEEVSSSGQMQVPLPLEAKDQNIPRPHSTLLVKNVDGYDADGKRRTPGQPLMLFVTGQDATTNNPIVRAINGRRENPTDEFSTIPQIPAGSEIMILANALYETQKEVDPDLIVPQAKTVYLQKRGMNQIVSDYFEAQKKRIPFSKAIIAEQALTTFKVKGNRTLYAGRPGKFAVQTPKVGQQLIYTTEGVRWQVKKELQVTGKWTFERLVALAKMAFTGEDVAKTMILLGGKNLMEQIQCIDYTKHPEVQICMKDNVAGWQVTNIHTVFGDIELKRDPTLDRLGWSNSGILLAPDRLVHYVYSAEHSSSDRVEGEEATRESVLVWDALALKGSCHIWIDGDALAQEAAVGANRYLLWDQAEAPETDGGDTLFFYLLADCPGIDPAARAGQMWMKVEDVWKRAQEVK